VDDVGELRQAEYCILELSEDTLEEHGDIEDEYPSLEHNDREDLENFCLYRNNLDFCFALETQYVLTANDD